MVDSGVRKWDNLERILEYMLSIHQYVGGVLIYRTGRSAVCHKVNQRLGPTGLGRNTAVKCRRGGERHMTASETT